MLATDVQVLRIHVGADVAVLGEEEEERGGLTLLVCGGTD